MHHNEHTHVPHGQILLPLSLICFVVAVSFGFQTTLIFKERDLLAQVKEQQTKPIEEAQKVKTISDNLALGVYRFAQQGDADSKAIVDRLQAAGININPNQQQQGAAGGTTTPAPGAPIAPPSGGNPPAAMAPTGAPATSTAAPASGPLGPSPLSTQPQKP